LIFEVVWYGIYPVTDTFVSVAVCPHEFYAWRKRKDLILKTVYIVAIKNW
jgi:hypothetical protein